MVKKVKAGENKIYTDRKNPAARKYKSSGIFDFKKKETIPRTRSKIQSLLNY